MFYEDILIDFAKYKVRYLLVGGMAVNLHGFDRVTGDLDVLLDMNDENIKKFVKVVKKWKLKPTVPVRIDDFGDKKKRNSWIKDKNMKAFGLVNPARSYERVDVIIESPIDFEKAYKKNKKMPLENVEVTVCSIPDLIKMKKYANRRVDQLDIDALKEIQRSKNE